MAGVHQTLREVRSLYAAMTGSAERAERGVPPLLHPLRRLGLTPACSNIT